MEHGNGKLLFVACVLVYAALVKWIFIGFIYIGISAFKRAALKLLMSYV